MLNILIQKVALVAVSPIVFFMGLAGYDLNKPTINDFRPEINKIVEQKINATQNLGASTNVADTVALFNSSLFAAINSSATTMQLQTATYNNGASTLASSTYAFIIDEGTSVEEMVIADCTGVMCTNMQRGIDRLTGTSTVTSLQFPHRRGASVKITDGPALLVHNRILQGIESIYNPLRYSSTVSTSSLALDRNSLASAGLVADTAFNGAGVINATTLAKGVTEIATQVEAASSTSLGSSGATIVIPASSATSTFNLATAPLRVIVTQNDGKIDSNFLASTIVSTSTTARFATSSVNIGSFPAYNIGKNTVVITTTGTTTFSVPQGITKLYVRVQGAGGSGGTSSQTGSAGSGGGAGGYSEKFVDVTGTTTIQVFVGQGGQLAATAGQWSTFGTNGSYFSATGGGAGSSDTTDDGASGGLGGVGQGGDINIGGEDGGDGVSMTSTTAFSGKGGSSVLGGGGRGGSGGGTIGNLGSNGRVYGGGGGGASNSSTTFGTGAQGVVIISW